MSDFALCIFLCYFIFNDKSIKNDILKHVNIQLPSNNMGLNCEVPFIHEFLKKYRYITVLHESCLIKSTDAEFRYGVLKSILYNFWLHAEDLCPASA